jgi:hypothetical protein
MSTTVALEPEAAKPVPLPVPEKPSDTVMMPPAAPIIKPIIPSVAAETAAAVSEPVTISATEAPMNAKIAETNNGSGFNAATAVSVASEEMVPVSPIAIASSRFKNIRPITDAEPLRKPTDLPTAQELKAMSGITDPLLDPDVDLGLEQLLGEWSIFRKSGVFGTGPKGPQHPLYLKIKDVPISLVLAGRFEGATAEIRQSITDYMNGWRYEQGIISEQDELFEHYLRHILDSQNRRRTA